MRKKGRWSEEMMSMALSEHAGPGLRTGGYYNYAGSGRIDMPADSAGLLCVAQAAFNDIDIDEYEDGQFTADVIGAFDELYTGPGMSPEALLRLMERPTPP